MNVATELQSLDHLTTDLQTLREELLETSNSPASNTIRKANDSAADTELNLMYDKTPSIAYTLTSDKTIYSVNLYGAKRFGYSTDSLIGHSISYLQDEAENTRMEKIYQQCLSNPEKVHHWKSRRCCKNGEFIYLLETARLGNDKRGKQYIFISSKEISRKQAAKEDMLMTLTHDNLTGIHNRHFLEQEINDLIMKGQASFFEHALCYIDLDHFNVINDICGHIAGDKLLCEIAEILQSCVRKYDAVARLGSDEFAILLKDCSVQEARNLAKVILRSIATHNFIWQGHSLKLAASIGLVTIVLPDQNATRILSAADSACCIAKEQGRNRIYLYRQNDPEQTRHYEEMQWVSRINTALDESRLRLFYQDIKSVKANNKGRYFEFLLRMEGVEGEMISPSLFIPAAERYGLITKIDRWVVRNALTWLSSDLQRMQKIYRACINLSGYSMDDQNFLEFLVNEIKKSAIPASKICLELTETAALTNVSSAVESMQALKELGCIIAIDDFGSGFSSFAYLKQLPTDVLKIDGMFVKDILTDPMGLALVKSINEISHVLGKQTIAEFVDDQNIMKKLEQIGVDFVQGCSIGMPESISNY